MCGDELCLRAKDRFRHGSVKKKAGTFVQSERDNFTKVSIPPSLSVRDRTWVEDVPAEAQLLGLGCFQAFVCICVASMSLRLDEFSYRFSVVIARA